MDPGASARTVTLDVQKDLRGRPSRRRRCGRRYPGPGHRLARPSEGLVRRPCLLSLRAPSQIDANRRIPMTTTMLTDTTPPLADVRRMVGAGTVVPIYREVRADL